MNQEKTFVTTVLKLFACGFATDTGDMKKAAFSFTHSH